MSTSDPGAGPGARVMLIFVLYVEAHVLILSILKYIGVYEGK